LSHVNHLGLVGTNHISGTADRLNSWPSSVTSLSHWPSTSV